MKILYVHRTQGKGVEGVHIMGIVNSMRKMGHEVDILSPNESAHPEKPQKESFYRSIARHAPEFVFEFLELGYNFALTKKLKEAFRKKRYDLIYERTSLMTFATVRFAKGAGIPVFLEVNYTAYMPLYRKRSALLEPLAKMIDRYILRNATHNFVVSNYLKDHLSDLGVPLSRSTVITNAADPESFLKNAPGDKIREKYSLKGKVVVGFVGGFYPWHGLKLFVESMRIAASKYGNCAALLVGDGPMRGELEAWVKSAGLENCVIFAGRVPHSELPQYAAAFDIGVMPDSNEYGSPMKIYEYMAMEIPVVAADYGPLRDGITHGENGLLFAPGNAGQFAACLLELAQDKNKRDSMGKKGRQLVVEDRNWFNQTKKIMKKYPDSTKG